MGYLDHSNTMANGGRSPSEHSPLPWEVEEEVPEAVLLDFPGYLELFEEDRRRTGIRSLRDYQKLAKSVAHDAIRGHHTQWCPTTTSLRVLPLDDATSAEGAR